MSVQSRKHRGMRTQKLVAEYLAAHGWPFAESTGAARQGSDITGTPDLAIEVKARTAFEPLAWIRQAVKAADGRVPFVVFRCNGQGEQVGDYPALIRTRDLVALLRQAGYGDGELPEEALGAVVGVGPDADRVVRLVDVLDQMNAKAVRRAIRYEGGDL